MLNRQYKPDFTIMYPDGTKEKDNAMQWKNIHYAALEYHSSNYVGGKYLEIGSNFGHSAFQIWASMRPKKMILCDMFIENSMVPYIKRTLVCLGCVADVVFLKGRSVQFYDKITDVFDVILVDGDHSPSGATKDLNHAWKWLKPGGTLLFDDTNIKALKNVFDDFCYSVEKNSSFIKNYDEWKCGCGVITKSKEV